MKSSTSRTLLFQITDDDAVAKLVIVLSSVYHVVPAAVGESDGHILSVEIDAEHPWLVDDVRQLVLEGDPGSSEMQDALTGDQVL